MRGRDVRGRGVAVLSAGLLVGAAGWPSSAGAADPQDGLTMEECVAIALSGSATVEEAQARVAQWEAQLAEVEALYYPKLEATGFIAPMFTIQFDDISEKSTPTRWRNIEDWGPYLGFEATLMQPLYTFGRLSAGEEAASEGVEVERAKLRAVRNEVALEVRKYYLTHLYTLSIMPTIDYATGILEEAEGQAQELYQKGSGEVTQVDLMKLRYGAAEVAKVRVQARRGAALSLEALKHTMGWPSSRELRLAEKRLPRRLPSEDPELAVLIAEAAQNRPEWAQVEHGERATLALAKAEFLANLPVLALAVTARGAYTPTVEDTINFYHNDPFNDFFAGVALVVQFDLAPWTAAAKEEAALAQHAEIEALHRFASTGVPLQVRLAYDQLGQARELVAITKDATKATKRWVTFAAAAFASGTGNAQDMLEGLAAYLQAKNAEYESLRDYFIAQAALDHAVGRARRGSGP